MSNESKHRKRFQQQQRFFKLKKEYTAIERELRLHIAKTHRLMEKQENKRAVILMKLELAAANLEREYGLDNVETLEPHNEAERTGKNEERKET